MPEGTFSIVVANILANPLKLLAPALLGRVAAHGALVLSGVLARQADEVIAVYKAADPTLVLSVWREEDGWAPRLMFRIPQQSAQRTDHHGPHYSLSQLRGALAP